MAKNMIKNLEKMIVASVIGASALFPTVAFSQQQETLSNVLNTPSSKYEVVEEEKKPEPLPYNGGWIVGDIQRTGYNEWGYFPYETKRTVCIGESLAELFENENVEGQILFQNVQTSNGSKKALFTIVYDLYSREQNRNGYNYFIKSNRSVQELSVRPGESITFFTSPSYNTTELISNNIRPNTRFTLSVISIGKDDRAQITFKEYKLQEEAATQAANAGKEAVKK